MGSNKLYLFDFDGTLTRKDSMIEFAKFVNPTLLFYIKAILFVPIYLLLTFKIIDNQTAKRFFLTIFIQQHTKQQLESFSEEFAIYFKKYIKTSANEYLNALRDQNDVTVVIVSSSLDLWLSPIAKQLGFACICTKAIFENDKFNGIQTNCYGKQKVLRIKEHYTLTNFDSIFAFGDSKGDKEMLDIATQKHYKFFSK